MLLPHNKFDEEEEIDLTEEQKESIRNVEGYMAQRLQATFERCPGLREAVDEMDYLRNAASGDGNRDVTHIKNWALKLYRGLKREQRKFLNTNARNWISIEGERLNGQKMLTGPVNEVFEDGSFTVTSGRKYCLVGGINTAVSMENDLSADFSCLFEFGFPENWKNCVERESKKIDKEAKQSLTEALAASGSKDSTPIRRTRRVSISPCRWWQNEYAKDKYAQMRPEEEKEE
eukprot:GHVN01014612.1.p1 GENE.GHVN01014612.1~~GHVN01014612.1.p1  ORF type:complete len:232 (-),score=18.67 GHVN01014612.1:144-839(-)